MRMPLGVFFVLLVTFNTAVAGWKAGVAHEVITPEQPMWMSGYASRDHAATGKLTELWAKALVLEDDDGGRGVIVTLDLVGIDRATAMEIRRQLMEAHNLTMSQIAMCTSHTHSGPVVGTNLLSMYDLTPEQHAQIKDYTAGLIVDIVKTVDKAMSDLQAADLGWGVGQSTFAVNRRENRAADVPTLREQGALKGPVDHEVPVFRVSREGKTVAVLFGYACHATTLSDYDWSGDWPGYAQIAIEKAHPGVTALFFTGCGADQNPLPRRSVELAEEYGARLAAAVDEVLQSDMQPVAATLKTTYEEIDLPFANVPTQEELHRTLNSDNKYEVGRAKTLLKELKTSDDAQLSKTYPYPIQTWRLGDVTGVFLGGEVVVDYSLEIKSLPQNVGFVCGYANDVMAYIPSERVLEEGGYEGGGAMVYYGLPSPWETGVEQKIIDTVRSQIQTLSP